MHANTPHEAVFLRLFSLLLGLEEPLASPWGASDIQITVSLSLCIQIPAI